MVERILPYGQQWIDEEDMNVFKRIVSLPLSPKMQDEDAQRVIDSTIKVISELK